MASEIRLLVFALAYIPRRCRPVPLKRRYAMALMVSPPHSTIGGSELRGNKNLCTRTHRARWAIEIYPPKHHYDHRQACQQPHQISSCPIPFSARNRSPYRETGTFGTRIARIRDVSGCFGQGRSALVGASLFWLSTTCGNERHHHHGHRAVCFRRDGGDGCDGVSIICVAQNEHTLASVMVKTDSSPSNGTIAHPPVNCCY